VKGAQIPKPLDVTVERTAKSAERVLSVAVHPDGASQGGLPALPRSTGMHARDCVPTAADGISPRPPFAWPSPKNVWFFTAANSLRTHWPNTRIVWRGDSHYGRVEAMEWAEDDGHALPSCTVTATSGSVHGATTRSCLIAPPSFPLVLAASILRAGSEAVDLAAIAVPTDKHLRAAATTQKQFARHFIGAVRHINPWTLCLCCRRFCKNPPLPAPRIHPGESLEP
jgi:hypothetical protein